jgi:hypothetical protein
LPSGKKPIGKLGGVVAVATGAYLVPRYCPLAASTLNSE